MKLNVRRAAFCAGLAMAAATVAGPTTGASAQISDAPDTEAPNVGGSVTWLVTSEPATMNPNVSRLATQGVIYWSAYDQLVQLDVATGEIIPRIAESVTSNADATVWTIKIRPGVMFTDGTPLDAAAVKANWDRLADPASAAVVQSTLAGFTGWTVVDPLTLEVTIPYSRGALPFDLANGAMGVIASPQALEKFGDDYGTTPDTTVGAGPFVLADWAKGDHLTFTRNPTYWDDPKPYLDEVRFRAIANPVARTDAIISDAADIAYYAVPDAEVQRGIDSGMTANRAGGDPPFVVAFNQTRGPFGDVRVRQALVLAADLDDLNAKGSGGAGRPATTWFPEGSPLYDPSLKQETNNLAAAQELIDEYVAATGGPVTGTLLVHENARNLGVALEQQWARLDDVDIDIDIQPPNAAVARRYASDFDAVFFTGPNPAAGVEEYYNQFFSASTGNTAMISDPVLDEMLTDGRGASTAESQREWLHKIARQILDQAHYLNMQPTDSATLTDANISGLHVQAFSQLSPADLWISS